MNTSFDGALAEALDECGVIDFNTIQRYVSTKICRNLSKSERQALSKVIKEKLFLFQTPSVSPVRSIKRPPRNVLICTAYTSDYIIGDLCSKINETYASRHGYGFRCDVMSYAEMLSHISPRTHCTWYKVQMIREELKRCIDIKLRKGNEYGSEDEYDIIVWIDADAIVVEHDMTIEAVINKTIMTVSSSAEMLSYPDLIVAADMSPSSPSPINAGVLIISVSDWSLSLWDDVWCHPSSLRYSSVYFYEQSALVKCLRMRHISLSSCAVHTAMSTNSPRIKSDNEAGADYGDDGCDSSCMVPTDILTEQLAARHVVVTACSVLNSNRICATVLNRSGSCIPLLEIDSMLIGPEDSSRAAKFIFHAVGKWNKLAVLRRVAFLYGVDDVEESPEVDSSLFRLRRGKCGGIPSRGINS